MKNTIQMRYEEVLIKNKFREYIFKKLDERLENTGGDTIWVGRSKYFLTAFFDSLDHAPIPKIHFLFDFSINATVSNFIISNRQELKFYLDCLPGMPSNFIRKIEEEQHVFCSFLFFCKEFDTQPEDILFKTVSSDTELLFNLNGIDLDNIKNIYFLKRNYSKDIKDAAPFQNHGFLTMQIVEDFRAFFNNMEYKNLKSLISQETKHFFQSFNQDYKSEYLDFCLENEINPFNFKDQDEETLIDLNFQLY